MIISYSVMEMVSLTYSNYRFFWYFDEPLILFMQNLKIQKIIIFQFLVSFCGLRIELYIHWRLIHTFVTLLVIVLLRVALCSTLQEKTTQFASDWHSATKHVISGMDLQSRLQHEFSQLSLFWMSAWFAFIAINVWKCISIVKSLNKNSSSVNKTAVIVWKCTWSYSFRYHLVTKPLQILKVKHRARQI